MSNYKDVLAVREQLSNQEHFGSAERENEQYLDSISGKLNELKQTWIAILDVFANSESIKSVLDVLISVSEGVETVVKALDDAGILLQTTFTAFTAGGSLLKNLAGFGESSYQIRQVGDSLQLVQRQGSQSVRIFSGLRTAFSQGTTFSQKFGNSLTTVTSNIKSMGKGIVSNLVPSLTSMLGAGLKGLAISAVFTGISWAVDKTINKYKNLDRELQAQANTSRDQLESLNKQKKGLEGLAEEYDKLAKKSKKTEDELTRYNELRQQIADLSPDLVIGYDENNNPILNLNGSLQDYIGNLETAIDRQKTLFANDSMEVGQNAIDGLKSSWNWDGVSEYKRDNLRLGEQNQAIITQRQNLINKLNEINKEHNFKDLETELEKYAKQNEKYNETIINGHKKVKEQYLKIAEETSKAQSGMNTKLMDNSAMKKASEEVKKLGSQMISAFDLSEVDSSKLDQMVFNMSKNLTSGEFDTALGKVVELRQELEKTYNFEEYESSIEQYIPTVAKFLGVNEDMARSMLKVPEVMKSSEDALDEFLRSMGKTKQMLNFDAEAQRLAEQFYEVENVLSQLTNTSNLVTINGKVQFDPQVVMDMQSNESIPEQIRKLLGEFNTDGVVDVGEIKLLMDVITAFKLGNTQESKEILADVQKQLDEKLGQGKINITDLKFDVDGKVENVNIDDKELQEKLSVLGDKAELKTLFTTEVIGLDKLDHYVEIVKSLPADSTHTENFIVDNHQALSQLKNYKEVKEWILQHPEVISKYKFDVEKDPELKKALEEFEKNNGKTSESTVKVNEEGADETNEKLEKVNEQADELSKDVNLSVNNGELQGSVESFEKLIEYSTKLKDGTYSISFKSDTSESINQINNLKNAINDLSGTFSSLPSVTVRIETAQASKNVTGLRNNVEKFKSLAGGLKTLTFKTETAQASKNVTGLRNKVDSYISARAGKSYSTRFNTETALASKNVTGLLNKVSSYVGKYGNRTIKTTFNVVTKYSTQGTPTTQSKVAKVSARSIPAYVPESYEVAQVNASPLSEFANQVQSDTVAMQHMARTGQAVSKAISSYGSSRASVISKALNKNDVINMVNLDVDAFKGLEDMLKRISNELDLLSKKADLAFGEEKITYLKRQIELLQQQQQIQNELSRDYATQKNELKYFLGQKGFKFNDQGDITNQVEKIYEMEKYVDSLEKQVNALGDEKNEALSNKYESAREELEKTKKVLSQYIESNSSGVTGATAEWYELQKQINEARMEIIQATIDAKNFKFEINAKKFEAEVEQISNAIDLIDKQINYAFGEDKDKLLQKKTELLHQQQEELHNLANQYRESANTIAEFLNSRGFIIEADGFIGNIELLEQFKDTGIYEEINEQLEKYIDLTQSKIPSLQKEWWELKEAIDETRAEIIEATIATKNFKFEINAKKFEAEVQNITNAIELLDKQLEYAVGEEKDKLFAKKIELLQQEQKEVHNLANQYREQAKVIGELLNSKGFIIETDGSIGNIEFLEQFKDSGIYEELCEQVDKYVDLTQNKVPQLSKEWWDLKQEIDDTRISILEAKDELSDIVLDINVTKINKAITKIRNEISKLEREIDKSFGSKKESLLNEKIEQLKQEQNKLHELANAYRKQKQEIYNYINSLGFIIHPDGEIGNPEYILNFKDDPAMFQYLQGLIDKYNNLGDTINGLSQDWWGLQDSIEDTQEQIEEARKELAKFIEEAKIDALLDKFNDLNHQLDLIDKKLQHATGKDKLDLLSQKLELIKKQQIELQKHWEYFANKRSSLQSELEGLGFDFDSSGNITNYISKLEELANSSSNFEEVKEKLEEYFDIQENRLPEIESSWLDFENAYKDVLKEQLNTTKDIEDKITKMYKKQVQDRIDEMNKETDAKIKALKKQKEAYNKYREETDYKNEYEDKLTEINDLQKQLDIAMRDTSLAGQKKVKELQKLLADAQKELDKLTQNKIDSDINDMFDKESERIEEENDKAIENLENEWSDSKIAEMVAQALKTGVFEGIDGGIEDLQSAMLKFAQDTGELFGVMGTVIKSELITNLDIAKQTVAELGQIIKDLDLEKFAVLSSASSFSRTVSGLGMQGYLEPVQNNYSSEIRFDSPLIYIEGNVDNDVLATLESYGDKLTKDIINKIAGAIR